MQISPKLIKIIISVLVAAIIVAGGIWAYFLIRGEKTLTLSSPNGGEVLTAGRNFKITWKVRGIGKVGIALIKGGKDVKWIAKDISAGSGKYDWQVFAWEEPRQDYRLGIYEYPWQEGNQRDYSDNDLTILGPRFASCDELSIEAEWSYLPSDYPDLRKVFITEKSWSGDLGGLVGADQKCQSEAQEKGLEGNWKALLGDDNNSAVDRLELNENSIFVLADSHDALPYEQVPPATWKSFGAFLNKTRASSQEKDAQGLLKTKFSAFIKSLAGEKVRTCHRLVAKDKNEFLSFFSAPSVLNIKRLTEDFYQSLKGVWIGKLGRGSQETCTRITSETPPTELGRNYSLTTTCENWTKGSSQITSGPAGVGAPIKCYSYNNPELGYSGHTGNQQVVPVAMGGLSVGIVSQKNIFSPYLGKTCDNTQRLICVEQ